MFYNWQRQSDLLTLSYTYKKNTTAPIQAKQKRHNKDWTFPKCGTRLNIKTNDGKSKKQNTFAFKEDYGTMKEKIIAYLKGFGVFLKNFKGILKTVFISVYETFKYI